MPDIRTMQRVIWICCIILLAFSSVVSGSERTVVEEPLCEYLINPVGVDVPNPRFCWKMISGHRGARQTAYRIIVSSSPAKLDGEEGDMWDSGKVLSEHSLQVMYQGAPLKSRDRCHWKVMIWDEKGRRSSWSEPAYWTMGLLDPDEWQAEWVGVDEPDQGIWAEPRYLRQEFEAGDKISRATVYVTALGLYELRINGNRIGDHELAPEWTNYHKRIQYQTYDVTNLIREGANAVGATLGNGWYCGGWQFWEDRLKSIYGTDPYFLMQLEIEYTDGTIGIVVSDNKWKGTTEGPLRFAGIYEGVTYDGCMEMPGWDMPRFDDGAWTKVKCAGEDIERGELVWQRNEPIRITENMPTVGVTEPKPGVFVFNLGQNIAGRYRIKVSGNRGDTVKMMMNEMLNPDGTVYMDNLHAGHLSKGDRQVNRYVCKGTGEEWFEPDFTYHGFRYVEVHGLKHKPTPEDFTGLVFHSDFRKTGRFTCSNELVGRLVENIEWSQRGNFMGIPTDCPQRDERDGYTGDAQFFMNAAIYNFDVSAFFHKWMVDVCQDSQIGDGWFADHAPHYGPGFRANVGWFDAGIICTYRIYRTYGDTRIIGEHYDAMKLCMEWQIATAKDGIRDEVGNGDWLNLGGGAANAVIGTAYYAHSLKLMAEMAAVTGRMEDTERYGRMAAEIGRNFVDKLIESDGKIRESSQTGYALAFSMGLVPPELHEAVAANFRKEIDRFDGHIATGFIGTSRIMPALHAAGADDLAYRLLLNEDYPSWLYPVKLGATTILEWWDGWTPEKGFQNSGMNSFNHYAFGSVGEYLYKIVAGIDELEPGFKKISIHPVPGDGLTWADAEFDSPYGKIASRWEIDGKKFSFEVAVPANTTALVYVPSRNEDSVMESGKPAVRRKNIVSRGMENGYAVLEVGSGQYRFSSLLP